MRVFLAGASGAIGRQLVPLLIDAGHQVAGMTRSPDKVEMLRELGAEPVVVDVYDASALVEAVVAFEPDLVMHQLTDLPPNPAEIPAKGPANARVRTEGTRNLIAAAAASEREPRLLAQSIAWELPGDAHRSVEEHEAMVLEAGGLVLRYGRFYGPGTYHPEAGDLPEPPAIHVAAAARRTVDLLDAPTGVIEIFD
jgi:nucleoside-diphosphate-sugar epimerase